MRYIKKVSAPDFFLENINVISKWEEYPKSKKPLKEYILEKEQNYLCIYCESKINIDNSHIEHIKPKAQNMFPELVFDYNNLVVSCNGNCHTEDNRPYTCGHIKENEFDNSKFLNPVELEDIRDYFEYDIDEGNIKSSSKDEVKSEYMINTLKLNEPNLTIARKKALKSFIRQLNRIQNSERKREKIIFILNNEDIPFISFLKFRFKDIF